MKFWHSLNFFIFELVFDSFCNKIVDTREKGVGACEKADGIRENAVDTSEKCQILCKNLQKLSKNEKFHKILQENYIFCAKTALARDKNRWRMIKVVGAHQRVGARQRLTVFFALARQRLICRLQCFLRAPTAYEHL